MRRRRRVEITVETSRLVMRRAAGRGPVWCPACSPPVLLVTPEEAAALAGVSTRAVYRRVEAGQLHFVETDAGQLLICPNSSPTATTAKEIRHA